MINTRFEIIKKIGEGRSSVYLCRDIEFPEKEFAIKILAPGKNENEKAAFLKEFFILQKLEHPYIIEAFDFGKVFLIEDEVGIETGSEFITLEFFNGTELLKSENIRDETKLREIVKQICSVLYYIHQSKYIYYDLKPENILVSFNQDKPEIRLIDLGLAEYSPSLSDYEIKGTAHYIAPELLKKEVHNYSVDFYSLGMILYCIVYNRFPYEAKSELEIYKATIDGSFDFPQITEFSSEFIQLIKKLLEKDINNRYSSALEIIEDLDFSIDSTISKEFLPAKVFSCREYAVNALSKYFADDTSSEVITIKGFDGVGKTALVLKISEIFPDTILISDVKGKSVGELIRYLLRQIIFSESVFPQLSEEEKVFLLGVLSKNENEILDEFRQAVLLLSSKTSFKILIDDFNLFDPLSMNLLLEIIPFLQVRDAKIIISESSEHDFISSRMNNTRDITIGPFTDSDLTIFLEESYYSEFPKQDLYDKIIAYSDLIPGNIKSFIKDLILLGILKFSKDGITFEDNQDKLSVLSQSHIALYDLRLANLSEIELKAVQILSAIDSYLDQNMLSVLLSLPVDTLDEVLERLQINNVIQRNVFGQSVQFTSEAIKKHIYYLIRSKKELHLNLAKAISEKLPDFSRLEKARQFELAEVYEESFNILKQELEESERHSAYAYMITILSRIKKFPLENEQIIWIKQKLGEIYNKVGDFQSALNTIQELKKSLKTNEIDEKLLIEEASSNIAAGDYERGKEIINNLLTKIEDVDKKYKLIVERAYADFELGRYDEATVQSDQLLNEKSLSAELEGRCYNLKGMINIYQNNNLESALENFQRAKTKFDEAGLAVRVSGIDVNIGNVYNILAKYEKAEEYWNKASKINQSTGNLDQEGYLHQNFGMFYLERQKYESAIESFTNAQKIFLSYGKKLSYGLVLINLGETYMKICEYEKSLKNLNEAVKLLEKLENNEEAAEALFLLAQVYYNVGFSLKVEEKILLLEKKLQKFNLPPKYSINLNFIKILLSFLKGEELNLEDISKVEVDYKSLGERNFMIDARFILIEALIGQEKYLQALEKLLDAELIDLCSQNSILEAKREYFLGLVSGSYASDRLLPPLVHFEKAYEIINNEHISELIWKVLFSISELYINRGNLNKAKRYVIYARELIYFIAERIESPRLRAAYLRHKERITTLQKLESFYPTN